MKTGLSMPDLVTEINRQAASKVDYAVDTRQLQMEPSGKDVVLRLLDKKQADVVEPLDIRQTAHRQIGTHLKIPAKYYDRMLEENPELLAINANAWFNSEPSQNMLRTLSGQARAFLSNRYRRIDHVDIIKAVVPVLGEMPDARFESVMITESRLYIKVVNPRIETEVSPGDIVQAGMIISNSEIGHGAVCIQPLLLRLVCMNGMVVNDAATRKNHIGRAAAVDEDISLYSDTTLEADDNAFLLKVQDTVRAAVDEARFNVVVNKMREAKGVPITTNNVPGIVKLAAKDYGLSDAEGEGVLNQLIADKDYTLFGLANAFTRYSQDVADYDRATEFESLGYDVMTMNRQMWNRYNREALPPVVLANAAA